MHGLASRIMTVQALCLILMSMTTPVLGGLRDLAHCDPLKKDEDCPPDPGFGGKTSFDFTKADWNEDLRDFWKIDQGTIDDKQRLDFNANGNGAAIRVSGPAQAPTLTTQKYIFFGKISVHVKAAKGNGLVTAIALKSDSGNEIDWELLGAYENQAQSNYFYDGEALFNTYNDTYELATSSFDSPHTYSVEWTDQMLRFSIDGHDRMTWRRGEIPGDKWPNLPMQVKIGVWTVTNSSDEGEIAWAGGVPSWEDGPFKAYFERVEIEDYAGGCTEAAGELEYRYDERTRGWRQVEIAGCKQRLTGEAVTIGPITTVTESPATMSLQTATGEVPRPTAAGHGDGSPPHHSGDGGSGDDDEDADNVDGDVDDEARAIRFRGTPSTLAAIICMGWAVLL